MPLLLSHSLLLLPHFSIPLSLCSFYSLSTFAVCNVSCEQPSPVGHNSPANTFVFSPSSPPLLLTPTLHTLRRLIDLTLIFVRATTDMRVHVHVPCPCLKRSVALHSSVRHQSRNRCLPSPLLCYAPRGRTLIAIALGHKFALAYHQLRAPQRVCPTAVQSIYI